MTDSVPDPIAVDRRQAHRLIAGLVILPLLGCDDDGAAADDAAVDPMPDQALADGGSPAPDAAADPDAGLDPDAGDPDAGADPDATPPVEGWASGGTASMVDPESYPDPFVAGAAGCALVAEAILGPCTTEEPDERVDISEGWTGLPMRMKLRVVDTDCNPLPGAVVSVWHTNVVGSYSGQTPDNDFCLLDQGYSAENFHRGVQTADAAGVVTFDTCYPGWYPIRAIHIHAQVFVGGVSTRVTQLYFDPDLTREIFAEHPDYVEFGQPRVTWADDGVIDDLSDDELAGVTMETARMADGALLAWKTITVT